MSIPIEKPRPTGPNALFAYLRKQAEACPNPYILFLTHCPECDSEGLGTQLMARPCMNLACRTCMNHTAGIKLVLATLHRGEVIMNPDAAKHLTFDSMVTRY